MTLRRFFFWLHLAAGSIAAIVILVMSVTGVLLMYERQVLDWADGHHGAAPPTPGAPRLPVEALLAKTREVRHALPSLVTFRADPGAAAALGYGREATVFVDPYTGHVLGEGSRAAREFIHAITDWHRWLGAEGGNRTVGRAITGASNLAFLFLVASGLFLWWPRKWNRPGLRAVTWFRTGVAGKARDFNWHNVIGFWCAVPLFFVVLTAVVMSYGWANNLLYRMTGSEPPARRGPPGGVGVARPPADMRLDGLDALLARVEQQSPGWQTISLRLPSSPRAPVTFMIDKGHRGRPDLRSQLTLDRRTGRVVRAETFASYNAGRRLRTWVRWVHTGEAGGVAGQTVAGIASAGGIMLVWTGLALAWRRFRAWVARTGRSNQEVAEEASMAVNGGRAFGE